MASSSKLCTGSYNCQGMGVDYLTDLFSKLDFLCIQEHWLFDGQSTYLVQNISDCLHMLCQA